MHIDQATCIQFPGRRFGIIKQAGEDGSVRIHTNGTVFTSVRSDQNQLATALFLIEVLLLVARSNTYELWLDPDLKKARAAIFQVVKLTMHDASTRTHALHIAGADNAAVYSACLPVAHAVLVCQFSPGRS